MKKLTNHMAGARGVNVKGRGTVWIEPGESVEIDPKDIIGSVPDLGKPAKADAPDDADEVGALKGQVAELTKQVEALGKDKAELTKQVEALGKPK